MTSPEQDSSNGWQWFESGNGPKKNGTIHEYSFPEITKAMARCFSGRHGEIALDHLRRLTLERSLGPTASDAALRHLEGQRQLVSQIHTLIAQGRLGEKNAPTIKE